MSWDRIYAEPKVKAVVREFLLDCYDDNGTSAYSVAAEIVALREKLVEREQTYQDPLEGYSEFVDGVAQLGAENQALRATQGEQGKVWIVRDSGDSFIEGVFTDKAQADAFAALFDNGRVDEQSLNTPNPRWWMTCLQMEQDGRVGGICTFTVGERPGAWGTYRMGAMRLLVDVSTRSKDKAIAVANVIREQLLTPEDWVVGRSEKRELDEGGEPEMAT
jgi:hypothetical protein